MKSELLPRVIEAYSRPTRIVRGKDVETNLQVLLSNAEFSQVSENYNFNSAVDVIIFAGG